MNIKLLRILAVGIYAMTMAACTRETQPSDSGANGQTQFYLSDFQQVRGVSIMIAEITMERSQDIFGSARWFSFGESKNVRVRNLIFLDARTLESRRLFSTNDFGLLNVTQCPEDWVETYNESGSRIDDTVAVEWFVYEVVKSDSNNDLVLNKADLFILSISDENGLGYAELLTDLSEIYGLEMVEYGKLVVTYLQNDRKLASLIDMDTKTILETKELINLGEDVK